MSSILTHTFFNRPADTVAQELLGCSICVRRNGKIERYTITETEAYMGPHDLASHASKGRTNRTDVMFRAPGTIYVYLVYGIYDMLNIVTGDEGYPAAVLIRGAGIHDGPGKLTKALSITRALNGKMLDKKTGLWIERPKTQKGFTITQTPRIGVSYAKEWAKKELRFVMNTQ